MPIYPLHRQLAERIERAVGRAPVSFRPIRRGYTPAARFVVTFSDGESLFAKMASNELTAGWLRDEHRIYGALRGSFVPRMHGWDDDGVLPLLLIEDLSGAHWPPPWEDGEVEALLETLEQVASSRLAGLPRLDNDSGLAAGWRGVAADPEPFLGLGIASACWLERALPVLLGAMENVTLSGDALLHCDVRSDNLCLVEGRVLLVDWNWACIGNPRIDRGALLPSLHAEGGPAPDLLMPDGWDMAAIMSGYFALNAGLPPIPDAPFVRHIQRAQLATALPWAVRALDLPPLDGHVNAV